jgi:hypothetical protein
VLPTSGAIGLNGVNIKKLNMENFYWQGEYYDDIDDLLSTVLQGDLVWIREMPEEGCITIELSDLKPAFQLDCETLSEILVFKYEDDLPEEFLEQENLEEVLKQSVDFEKLNKLIPKYYYPNGKFVKISKNELLEFIKNYTE